MENERYNAKYKFTFTPKVIYAFHATSSDLIHTTFAQALTETFLLFFTKISEEYNNKSDHKKAKECLRGLSNKAGFKNNIQISVTKW